MGSAALLLVLILFSNSTISRPGTLVDSSLLSDEVIEEIIPEEISENYHWSLQKIFHPNKHNKSFKQMSQCHDLADDLIRYYWHGSCHNIKKFVINYE